MADDLNKPLGQDKKPRRRVALSTLLSYAIGGALVASFLAFIVWTVAVDDPLGGEPVAMVQVIAPGSLPRPPSADALHQQQQQNAKTETRENAAPAGSKTVTIIDGSSGKREEVMIPGTPNAARGSDPATPAGKEGSAAGANPRLIENSRHGPIPKIGADGARPADAYAQQAKGGAKVEGARIAIIVGGLGIGQGGTEAAFAKLPRAVTFAFSPYAANLEGLAARTRNDSHEMLLQVPMEPFDYPDNDPGPQTLLTGSDAGQNIDRMHWMMSRFQGYVGIANYMGARFTASEPALGPVLRETAKRGLIYVDDGSSPRSLAGQIAGGNNLPFAKADVVIDAVPSAAEIDRALSRLETAARERGVAVGIASALPVAIERIAKWAKTAEGRGIALVPISAAAAGNKPKSS